jgi:DNA-binding HxlR family transcriptional regulator
MSKKWKNFDEGKIAEILSSLGDGPKHFNEIFFEMNAQKTIRSKTTLSQYLKYLIDENRINKIVSTEKGKRIAYELVSDEDRQLAVQAYFRKQVEQINNLMSPTLKAVDPQSIEITRKYYMPGPKPTPSEFLSRELYGMVCTILQELEIQLGRYEQIMKLDHSGTDVWIESSFDRLDLILRDKLAIIALCQNAGHYTHDELVNAANSLHREFLDKSREIDFIRARDQSKRRSINK